MLDTGGNRGSDRQQVTLLGLLMSVRKAGEYRLRGWLSSQTEQEDGSSQKRLGPKSPQVELASTGELNAALTKSGMHLLGWFSS